MNESTSNAIPNILFRYMSLERGEGFIGDRKLRFSNPTDYNDPFEFSLGLNHSFPWAFGVSLISLMLLPVAGAYEFTKRARHKRACEACTEHLGKTFSVCCFCEEWDNLLLWAHYARCHSGIVIGFFNSISQWGNDMLRVRYDAERVKAPKNFKITEEGITNLSAEIQRRILVTKAICWSYEKEWRCVKSSEHLFQDEYGRYMVVDANSIASLTFGHRINFKKKKEMYELAKINFPGALISEAIPSQTHFKVDIEIFNPEAEESSLETKNI